MIQKTLFPFKLETTKSNLTTCSGLALMAEFNHGIGLRELTDKYLPKSGSNRGFKPSVFVDSLVLMLQGGGRSLEDIRELKNEEGLMNSGKATRRLDMGRENFTGNARRGCLRARG